jgi:hypothetical protein
MPELRGVDPSGSAIVIDYKPQQKALLFVLSTKCPVCDANWPKWDTLLSNVNGSQVRLVFANVSGAMTDFYLDRYKLRRGAVLSKVDPQSILDYNFRTTPQTVLVGPLGRIEKVWSGLLSNRDLLEIQNQVAENGRYFIVVLMLTGALASAFEASYATTDFMSHALLR